MSILDNNDFYPTPLSVIRKMIDPHKKDIHNMYILEPSAGKGDILDAITGDNSLRHANNFDHFRVDTKRCYAIEQSPDLTYILQKKGYKVVGNDFLQWDNQYLINLILMNPPFSTGDEHLLKAWDCIDNGEIVCLLNSETINNPYTSRRKLLKKIIEDNGTVEDLGNVFSNAERKTNVDISLVRLSKKSESKLNFDFLATDKEETPDFTEEIKTGNQLTLNDKLGAYLRSYDKSKEALVEYIKAKRKLLYYTGSFLSGETVSNLIENSEKGSRSPEDTYNTFVDNLKSRAWSNIISKMGMEKYMTSSVQQNFREFKSSQGAVDLTRANIMQLILMISNNSGNILKQAVVDVFDMFTMYHKENRCHIEGWKTNEAWKVNRKVILPNFVEMGYGGYYGKYSRYSERYDDIDKAMCFLSGKRYEDFSEPIEVYDHTVDIRKKFYKMESLQNAILRVAIGDSSIHESEFFTFRCYKKGTLHITFKDESLWVRFNQEACEGKFQLGGEYK